MEPLGWPLLLRLSTQATRYHGRRRLKRVSVPRPAGGPWHHGYPVRSRGPLSKVREPVANSACPLPARSGPTGGRRATVSVRWRLWGNATSEEARCPLVRGRHRLGDRVWRRARKAASDVPMRAADPRLTLGSERAKQCAMGSRRRDRWSDGRVRTFGPDPGVLRCCG